MLLHAVRGVAGLGHVIPASVPMALLGLRAISTTEWQKGSRRFHNVWEMVLHSAKINPGRLHDIVDVLSKHCVASQTAPPLDAFNELLRLCDAHGDVASVHKLTQMSMAVSMHLDEQTYMRLDKFFNYFPRPFPDSARMETTTSSNGSIYHHHGSQVINPNILSTAPAAHGNNRSALGVQAPQAPNTSSSSSSNLDNTIGFEPDSCPSAHGQPTTSSSNSSTNANRASSSSVWPGASIRPWPRRPGGYDADISAKSSGPAASTSSPSAPDAPTANGQGPSHSNSSSSSHGSI